MTTRPDQPQPPTDPRHPGSGPMQVQRSPVAPGANLPDEEVPLQPHERDQSMDATADAPDPQMLQAHQDLAEGQVDTDMRVQPGLDAERRRALVGGAGGGENPPREATRNPVAPDAEPSQSPAADSGGSRTAAGSNYGNWVPERAKRLHPDVLHPEDQALSQPAGPPRDDKGG
jgi:hypothetical protein